MNYLLIKEDSKVDLGEFTTHKQPCVFIEQGSLAECNEVISLLDDLRNKHTRRNAKLAFEHPRTIAYRKHLGYRGIARPILDELIVSIRMYDKYRLFTEDDEAEYFLTNEGYWLDSTEEHSLWQPEESNGTSFKQFLQGPTPHLAWEQIR